MTDACIDPHQPMYRLDRVGAAQGNPYHPYTTRRPPGNVPYVVDNLWEWVRPADFPSRRHCVCASPSAALARELGGTQSGAVYRVARLQDAKVAQIVPRDARYHPDAVSLHKVLVGLLGISWLGAAPLAEKHAIAPLWMPCLTKDEVEQLFAHNRLAPVKEQLRESIRFWHDARLVQPSSPWPFDDGEIFFEASAWSLMPSDADEG